MDYYRLYNIWNSVSELLKN